MKLYTGGYLTYYMPGRTSPLALLLAAPTPLIDILNDLQIPIAEVHLVAINGDQAELENAIIQDKDVVRIFSSVDGG